MKRTRILSFIPVLMTAGMVLFSCGDEDPIDGDTGDQGEEPITPVEPGTKEALTPSQQKERMQQISKEFMNQVPAYDFEDIADLYMYVSDEYEDYEWDSVEEWAEDIYDATLKATGNQYKETEKEYGYTYNYFYTEYTNLILASNFTGHFTANRGEWVYSKANDLQFIFTDKLGKECVLKLTTSGNVKKVHAACIEDWKDYDWEDGVGNEYIDRTELTVGVPEHIVVTLTQGGNQVVKTSVDIDLASISGEEFDISKNALTTNCTTELNNGYTFEVKNVAYHGNVKAAAALTMKKQQTTLLSLALAADLKDIPSCNVSAFSHDFDIDDYETDKTTATNAFVKLDVMGKMQIQGSITDVHKYADYLEKADDNDDNEQQFKSDLNQANGLSDINLFYDNTATKQANVKWEAFVDEQWNGYTYWTAEPVLLFFDGSSYSTFSAFFDEDDFEEVIDLFEDLADRYANLVDEEIDW